VPTRTHYNDLLGEEDPPAGAQLNLVVKERVFSIKREIKELKVKGLVACCHSFLFILTFCNITWLLMDIPYCI
jgi:hypothetical protein